jgi:hypothetical protein
MTVVVLQAGKPTEIPKALRAALSGQRQASSSIPA